MFHVQIFVVSSGILHLSTITPVQFFHRKLQIGDAGVCEELWELHTIKWVNRGQKLGFSEDV